MTTPEKLQHIIQYCQYNKHSFIVLFHLDGWYLSIPEPIRLDRIENMWGENKIINKGNYDTLEEAINGFYEIIK